MYNSLLSIIGNLALNEKRITREDVDTFLYVTGKYFAQYEKLRQANVAFDEDIKKFNVRLYELQFDIKEFMADIIRMLHADLSRKELRIKPLEELLLRYLNESVMENIVKTSTKLKYPGDGVKTSKEIVYGIQKLFDEYLNLYLKNYNEIRNVLLQTKELGNTIDVKQIDLTLQDFDILFRESKEADIINLRLNTLFERLNTLVIAVE